MFRSIAALAVATVVSAVQLQPEQLPANQMYLTEVHGGELTDAQITEYRQAFRLFDKDGSKKITTKELGNVLRSLGENPTELDLKEMIKEIDTNKDGNVNFNEFLVMMKNRMVSIE